MTDLGKRHAFTVGLAFKDRSGLNLAADFTMDIALDSAEDAEDGANWMNAAIKAGMNVDRFMPFVKFAWSNYTQNNEANDNDVNAGIGQFDDNKIEWTVGSHMRMDGNAFKPYLAVHGEHGKHFKSGTTEEETGSNMDIKLGVMSKF